MKISLRELFCLTTVAAVLLSWWVDRLTLSREVKRLAVKLDTLEGERFLAQAARDDARNELKVLRDRLESDRDRWAILQGKTASEEELLQAIAGSRPQLISCGVEGGSTTYVLGPFGESASTVSVRYDSKKGKLELVSGEHSGHDEHFWRDRFRFERNGDKFVRVAEPREERPLNGTEVWKGT